MGLPGPGLPWSARWATRADVTTADIVLATMALCGWLLTAEGMVAFGFIALDSHVLEPYATVTGRTVSYVVALGMHYVVYKFYQALATRSLFRLPPGMVANRLLAFAVVLASLSFGLYANVYGLTFNAKAVSVQQALAESITLLHARLLDADRAMVAAVSGHESELRTLSTLSAEGQDETRIRRCGPRCKDYLQRARQVRERYAALFSPMDGGLSPPTDAPLTTRYQAMVRALGVLATREAVFATFCTAERGSPCPSSVGAITADPRYRDVYTRFESGETVTPSRLIRQKVAADLLAMAAGAFDPDTALALFIGLLPELISLSMVLHKAFVTTVPATAHRLRTEARELRERDQALDDVLAAGLRVSAKHRLWQTLHRAGRRMDAAAQVAEGG